MGCLIMLYTFLSLLIIHGIMKGMKECLLFLCLKAFLHIPRIGRIPSEVRALWPLLQED